MEDTKQIQLGLRPWAHGNAPVQGRRFHVPKMAWCFAALLLRNVNQKPLRKYTTFINTYAANIKHHRIRETSDVPTRIASKPA